MLNAWGPETDACLLGESALPGRFFHYTGRVNEINLEGNALVCLQQEGKEQRKEGESPSRQGCLQKRDVGI